jgi:hypothetical protein
LAQLIGVFRAQINLITHSVKSEGNRLSGFGTIKIIDQENLDALCH